jgi:hypothetical protein
MDDQVKDQAAAPDAEATRERYSTGIKPLDTIAHKVDDGVRTISKQIHAPVPPEDPERPRVSIGVQPIDNAVYKIDDGVRKISQGLHKAVDSITKKS